MIWHMLRNAGLNAGIMTTVAWGVDQLTPELGHMTTVDAFTLNNRIHELKEQGVEYLVLEVTSHALAEYRTFGIPVDIAVFTNLTHDHLDYHKTFVKYRDAKGKWAEAATIDTRLLSTETAGGFTGITLGMFAVSKKGGGFSYADFNYLNYR